MNSGGLDICRLRHFGSRALLLLLCVSAVLFQPREVVRVKAAVHAKPAPEPNADAVCAKCHREIFDRYEQTPMARASGRALDGLLEGGFTHPDSGITYAVQEREGEAVLTFDRPSGTTAATAKALHGSRQLEYFIGSNHRGRTYLYQEGKQWFEAPINYYSHRAVWDMAPNFDHVSAMPAPLPTDANCLHCHATAVATPLPQARNAFAAAPFAQGGIGCAACHGDPTQHLAAAGHGAIVNPDKLSVARRDSACLQCHLEGDATVYRPGTSLASFRAGDDLADHAVYFVKASRESGGGRASSQYEALLRSACKRAAGDRLTCTTCHDPHSSPAPEDRVAWFRGRCVSCHNNPAIAERHHPEQQDCAVCHMPTPNATDISHEQSTDHNIQARPASGSMPLSALSHVAGEDLLPVGMPRAGDRETGLAYAQLAGSGDRVNGERAQRLLRRAEAQGADDAALHTNLGYLNQRSGDKAAAMREYMAALQADPFEATALTNLAVMDAAEGHVGEAIALLTRAIKADPSKTPAGMNLAFLECSMGQQQQANDLLALLVRVHPDDPVLRNFISSGSYAGQSCGLKESLDHPHATR